MQQVRCFLFYPWLLVDKPKGDHPILTVYVLILITEPAVTN